MPQSSSPRKAASEAFVEDVYERTMRKENEELVVRSKIVPSKCRVYLSLSSISRVSLSHL